MSLVNSLKLMKKILYTAISMIILWLIYFFWFIHNSYVDFNELWIIIYDKHDNRIMANTQLFEDFIQDKQISTVEELLDNFFIFAQFDYIPNYSYEVISQGNSTHEIVVVVPYIASADKYVMTINLKDKRILQIKRNWKCRKGRGHTYWWIGSCY